MEKTSLAKRIVRRLRLEKKLFLLRMISRFKAFNPYEPIIIFSDPRGGGTWLAEIINNIPDSFIYWEPLNKESVTDLKQLNFSWRQHIPKEADWPEAKVVLNKILTIGYLNEWTALQMSPKQFMKSKVPIIKFCRANDLASWLVNQYNFERKPISLLRHPFAVVASQLKKGGWNYDYTGFEIPKGQFNEKYLTHRHFLESLKTKEEALVATWCLSNKSLLKANDQWITIYYENLIQDPEKYIKTIFSEWKLPYPENSINLKTVSSTNVDFIAGDIEKQLGKWQNVFDEDQIIKLQAVLDYFEINIYSKDSLYPSR